MTSKGHVQKLNSGSLVVEWLELTAFESVAQSQNRWTNIT